MNRFKGYYQKKAAPRAQLVSQFEDKVVLTVDMDAYYEWLETKLPLADIAWIKHVDSREKMNEFFQEHGIDFVFQEQTPMRDQMLEDFNRESG